MHASLLAWALVSVPILSLAGPIKYTRDTSSTDAASLTVLQFAQVLESLENEFYSQALQTFTDQDFVNAGFSAASIPTQIIQSISNDEASHLKFLNSGISALGGTPLSCTFNFGSALNSVADMLPVARLVENVGVAAYLGGTALLTDPDVLTQAGSIATIESRHQTLLNIMSSTGSAIPQAFDIVLSPPEIIAIAGGFISGCELPIQANNALTITNTGTPTIGTQLTFSFNNMPSDTSSLSCQMMFGGQVTALALPYDQCIVPAGINGPVAIYITKDDNPLATNVVVRAQSDVLAGPAMAFIDSSPEALGDLVRPSSSNPAVVTSNTTISSSAASSIINSSGSSSSIGGPNLSTGSFNGGNITVVGWMNLPSSS